MAKKNVGYGANGFFLISNDSFIESVRRPYVH
jgi:hypothetical protein